MSIIAWFLNIKFTISLSLSPSSLCFPISLTFLLCVFLSFFLNVSLSISVCLYINYFSLSDSYFVSLSSSLSSSHTQFVFVTHSIVAKYHLITFTIGLLFQDNKVSFYTSCVKIRDISVTQKKIPLYSLCYLTVVYFDQHMHAWACVRMVEIDKNVRK